MSQWISVEDRLPEKEFDDLRKYRPISSVRGEFETGLSRDERYIFNKIRYVEL